MNTAKSKKVIWFAFLANMVIFAVKFLAGFLVSSASLLAEAIHSLVDSLNQVLLLIGQMRSKNQPNADYPLGFSREIYIWSFMVAILLFSMGGLFALYEGALKIKSLKPLENYALGFGLLIISVILELLSFWTCYQEVKKQTSNIFQWVCTTKSSDLLIVFIEDMVALLSLFIALLGLFMTWLTSNPFWDGITSLVIGLFLIITGLFLGKRTASLLVGENTDLKIKEYLEIKIPELFPQGRLLQYIALQIGPQEIMLSYKVHPGTMQNVSVLINTINALEKELKKNFPAVIWQFVEPDYFE